MADFFVSTLGPEGARSENQLDWSRLLASDASDARTVWTIPEAFLAVLFAAIACDGEIAPVKEEELRALMHRSLALKSLSTQQLAEINVSVVARLLEDDDALKQACATLPQEMRLPLFAHALDLVLADGELTADEADFLNAIVHDLALDHDSVERVAGVIALKNRF